jgi:DNA-directed RNA polymerase
MRVAEDDRTMDRAQLLRTFHKDVMSAAKHAISTGQMAPALRAINTLQAVPFTIKPWIMDVIVDCYNRGIKVDGLPRREARGARARLDARSSRQLDVEERKLLVQDHPGLKKANRTNDATPCSSRGHRDVDCSGWPLTERFHTR